MNIRISMRQEPGGRWLAQTLAPLDGRGIIKAGGASRDRCLAAIRRSLGRALPERTGGDAVTLLVEIVPVLAGVAEAAEVMGWDKRRVITYIDRGRFPEPLQTLASGRVWSRSDVEEFRDAWRSRQRQRRRSN